MEKFTPISGNCVPLPLNDVDTDLIIPAQYMTSTSREGYGQNLFRRARDTDPDFPTNKEVYSGAQVLVSGGNFGCGSSREHAVWALMGAGFRAVIAKSFADIFFGNSAKNGLLLVKLDDEVVDRIISSSTDAQFKVDIDLVSQTVLLPDGEKVEFEYDSFRKHCLLEGLDDIDYIFGKREKITEFRIAQEKNRFFSTRPTSS